MTNSALNSVIKAMRIVALNSASIAGGLVHLCKPSWRKTLHVQMGHSDPDQLEPGPETQTLRLELSAMIQAKDWVTFGKTVRMLERKPADLDYGHRSYDVAAQVYLAPLFEAEAGLPGAPGQDDFAAMDAVLAMFSDRAIANPHVPMLSTLLAYALTCAATMARGQTYGRRPTAQGLMRSERWIQDARVLLMDTGRDPSLSPLLARAAYWAVLGATCSIDQLRTHFATICRADPGNLAAWQEHALYMMPGWYGTKADVVATAEYASEICGTHAYARILLSVCRLTMISRLPAFSPAVFMTSLSQDVARHGPTMAVIYARNLLAANEADLCRWVVRAHLDKQTPKFSQSRHAYRAQPITPAE